MKELDQYLNSGPKLTAHNYRFAQQKEWGSDCPWGDLRQKSTSEIIAENFESISDLIPETILKMNQKCESVVGLVDNGVWYLLYIFNTRNLNPYQILIGGAPGHVPVYSSSMQENEWCIPVELAEFYAVHNGFGAVWPFDLFWNSDCIVPSTDLTLLSDFLIIDDDERLSYNPEDLLGFFQDGGGNGQYFYRTVATNAVESTFDWDHETRELSHEQSFWKFTDDFFSEMIDSFS